MKLDLINNVNDREMVMKEENKPKLLDLLRKFGDVVDYMTEPMVARFYGVDDGTIKWYGTEHGEELSQYGYRVVKGEDLKRLRDSQAISQISPKTRALRLYPIEAVVVIGMMLTESKVAEDLRSEIIKELFGVSVNEEERLSTELGMAIMNGDMKNVISTTTKLFAIKNKKIETLEGENERKQKIINDLVYNVPLAEKRQRINQIVRHGDDDVVGRWKLLYGEFNLKHHMNVGKRADNRGMSKIAYIESEGLIDELYELVVKLFETDVNDLLEHWKNTIESSRKGN